MNQDLVVLVDEYGCDLLDVTGKLRTAEKMEAHRRGLLHRAVSVFIFNETGDVLLQRRAPGKYHSPQKWSNTCCTHPFPGETPLAAAGRRLNEEMGLTAHLREILTLLYRFDTANGLIEHEFNHIFFGFSSQNPKPNQAEVSAWKWVTERWLERELATSPKKYSPWLSLCFNEAIRDWYVLQTTTGKPVEPDRN